MDVHLHIDKMQKDRNIISFAVYRPILLQAYVLTAVCTFEINMFYTTVSDTFLVATDTIHTFIKLNRHFSVQSVHRSNSHGSRHVVLMETKIENILISYH